MSLPMKVFDLFVRKTTFPLFLSLLWFVVYLSIFPTKSISIYEQPIEVSKRSYHVGEYLEYESKYCRHSTTVSSIVRNVIFLTGSEFRVPTNNKFIDEKYIASPWRRLLQEPFNWAWIKIDNCTKEKPVVFHNDFLISKWKFSKEWRYTIETVIKYQHNIFNRDRVIVYFEPFYIES